MGTITILRSEAVAALKGDWLPLRGDWVSDGERWRADRRAFAGLDARRCRVCAVGAVLRAALRPAATGDDVWRACDRATKVEGGGIIGASAAFAAEQAAEGRYLCALSCYYEGLPADLPPAALVGRLVAFVEAHWPEAFAAEVGEFAR